MYVLSISIQVDGTAIGFMSLSTDVNLDLLNECFELGLCYGLRKPHENDETTPKQTPTPAQSPEPGKVKDSDFMRLI